jgi:hypothetical protein
MRLDTKSAKGWGTRLGPDRKYRAATAEVAIRPRASVLGCTVEIVAINRQFGRRLSWISVGRVKAVKNTEGPLSSVSAWWF